MLAEGRCPACAALGRGVCTAQELSLKQTCSKKVYVGKVRKHEGSGGSTKHLKCEQDGCFFGSHLMSVIEKKPIIQSVFSLKTSFELFPFELKCFPLEIQSPFFPSFFLFFLMRDNMITAIF